MPRLRSETERHLRSTSCTPGCDWIHGDLMNREITESKREVLVKRFGNRRIDRPLPGPALRRKRSRSPNRRRSRPPACRAADRAERRSVTIRNRQVEVRADPNSLCIAACVVHTQTIGSGNAPEPQKGSLAASSAPRWRLTRTIASQPASAAPAAFSPGSTRRRSGHRCCCSPRPDRRPGLAA